MNKAAVTALCTAAGFSVFDLADLPGAGGPGVTARVSILGIALAVCEAESDFNEKALNHNTNGTTDYGLFQINEVNFKTLGLTPTTALDPTVNVAAAYKLSKGGTNWQPWSAYKSGAAGARYAASGGPTGSTEVGVAKDVGDAYDATAGALGGIADAIGAFFSAVLDAGFWKRVGIGAAGLATIAAGAALISEDALQPLLKELPI